MDKVKNIIVIPICGFANRLRFISTAYSLSKKYDCNLQIYWEKSSDCNIGFDEIFVNIGGISHIDSLPDNYTYFGHEHLSSVISKVNGLNKTIDNLIIIGSHEYIIPQITKLQFLRLKTNLYNSIKWHESILNIVDSIYTKNNLDKYICVHYRGIDKRFDENDLKNSTNINFNDNSPLDNFNRYISMINDNYKVLLFSNIKDIEINNVIRLNNIDCNRNSKEDMINSIVEFIIMSRSKLIIGSYFSSFSDEASFFNIIPKIIPFNIDNKLDISSYHCNFLNLEDGILALNFNYKSILDCFNY